MCFYRLIKDRKERKLNKTVMLVGLGNMGAALARTLLDADYETWVWNRTKEKADTLLERGLNGVMMYGRPWAQ